MGDYFHKLFNDGQGSGTNMEGREIQEGGNLDYYYIICIGEVKEVVFVIDEAMRLNYFQMSYKLFL